MCTMQWKSRERWAELKEGINCPMCADFPMEENKFSFLVKELDHSYVRLPKNQYCYGYTIVGLKRHANELFDLGLEELLGFWSEVALVARALDEIHHPAKIDYLIFGHHCPHVHCHLVLQTFDNDPSAPVKMDEKEEFLSQEEYWKMIEGLRQKIQDLSGK